MSAHIPVLLHEVTQLLAPAPGKTYLDCTFGRGGHTQVLLEAGGKVVGLDMDETAVQYAATAFASPISTQQCTVLHLNFCQAHANSVVQQHAPYSGILVDFGVSSPQLDQGDRGFSFQHDAPLDMRMDRRLGVTAADLLQALGKHELSQMLKSYVQESRADRIAEEIVKAREKNPIRTTRELSALIERVYGGSTKRGHIHPATKTFLALRMVVNGELQSIELFLNHVLELLAEDGVVVCISFQEMEDRLVKRAMRSWEEKQLGVQLTKHPLEASGEEVKANPRSRSAKLRAFRKETI